MFRRPLPSWRLLVGAIQGCPRTCPVVGPQAKSPAMSQAWQSPDCQVSKPVLRPPSQFHLLISQEEETAHLCHLQPSFRLGTPLPLSLPSSFHPTEVLLIGACISVSFQLSERPAKNNHTQNSAWDDLGVTQPRGRWMD